MKEDKILLTIFTPTYNHEKYIGECLENIVKQKTNFKYEVIVADDCSSDKTVEIVKEYQKKYPEIIKPIFRSENIGAMNNFIETLNNIHTKYVALCDGDDFWIDDKKLQTQVDFLEKNKDYSICTHKTKIFFEDKSQPDLIFPQSKETDYELTDLLHENFIVANTVVYRWKYKEKDSFKKEFPKNIVPGDYFVHLMHASIGKIHLVDKIMSNYRRQPSGMWYLSSQIDKQDLFFIKYGIPYLRFYNSIEKKLKLNRSVLEPQVYWIITGILSSYKKNKKYLNIIIFCIRNMSYNKHIFIKYLKAKLKIEKIKN